MSKKRLEEIKEEYKWAVESSIATRLADSEIEWLIKQAERKQELERQNKRYREYFGWIIQNSTDKYAVQASYEALEGEK